MFLLVLEGPRLERVDHARRMLAATVADQPEDPADKGVLSRITKVTVYSDRALVTREAQVALTAEPTVFRFRKLPGWVDEGSVRATSSAGKIVDACSRGLRITQSGLVHNYAMTMVLGMVVIVAFYIFR